MPLAPRLPAFENPTSTPGVFELQNADGSDLYRFNMTCKPTNAADFLKPNVKLESAGGSPVQWDTGDNQVQGGVLMMQERKEWANAHEEGLDLGMLMRALATTPVYLANLDNHKRCLLLPGNKRDAVPNRGYGKYGLSELNVYLRPANKDDAAELLRESDT